MTTLTISTQYIGKMWMYNRITWCESSPIFLYPIYLHLRYSLELSIFWCAPFTVGFQERKLDYEKSDNAPFLASFSGRIKIKHIRNNVKFRLAYRHLTLPKNIFLWPVYFVILTGLYRCFPGYLVRLLPEVPRCSIDPRSRFWYNVVYEIQFIWYKIKPNLS